MTHSIQNVRTGFILGVSLAIAGNGREHAGRAGG